jgi:hypothetical protein
MSSTELGLSLMRKQLADGLRRAADRLDPPPTPAQEGLRIANESIQFMAREMRKHPIGPLYNPRFGWMMPASFLGISKEGGYEIG